MKQKEKRESDGQPLDGNKCQETAGVMALLMTGQIAKSRPQSIAEGLLMITLAVGRVLHVLGALLGVEPKVICRDFCASLTRYFEMGGDSAVDALVKTYKQKGN